MSTAETIRSFVTKELVTHQGKIDIQDEDSLIQSGVIDSLGILKMLAFLHSEFSIKVADQDVVPENFESIKAIASFVDANRPISSRR